MFLISFSIFICTIQEDFLCFFLEFCCFSIKEITFVPFFGLSSLPKTSKNTFLVQLSIFQLRFKMWKKDDYNEATILSHFIIVGLDNSQITSAIPRTSKECWHFSYTYPFNCPPTPPTPSQQVFTEIPVLLQALGDLTAQPTFIKQHCFSNTAYDSSFSAKYFSVNTSTSPPAL